jgi:intracellular multiplication protein IcmE
LGSEKRRAADISGAASVSAKPGGPQSQEAQAATTAANATAFQAAQQEGGSNIALPLGDLQPLPPVPERDQAPPPPPPPPASRGAEANPFGQTAAAPPPSSDGVRKGVEAQVAGMLERFGKPQPTWGFVVTDSKTSPAQSSGNGFGSGAGVAGPAMAPVVAGGKGELANGHGGTLGSETGRGDGGGGDGGRVLLEAGNSAYGRVLVEANSDVPTEVGVLILEGPLKGARVFGMFKAGREVLALSFSRMTFGGREVKIQAIAVDPDTNSPALASDVQHHYVDRVVLPGIVGFLAGLGDAAARSATTISVSPLSVVQQSSTLNVPQQLLIGAGKAAQAAAQAITQDAAGIKPTVTYAAGLPVGVLFLADVRG